MGEQAAKFSMYAPLVALAIGCLGRAGGMQDRSAAMVLATINMLLIVAGFILGIVALISVKKHSPERILGRAIIGIILNGLVLALILFAFSSMGSAGQIKKQVVGAWQYQSGPDRNLKTALITFNADDTFKMQSTFVSGGGVSMTGKWSFSPPGSDGSMNGQKIALGAVKRVDLRELVLASEKGDETFKRAQ